MFRLPSICINKSYRMSLFITTTCHFYYIYNVFTSFFTLLKRAHFTFYTLQNGHFPVRFYTCGGLYVVTALITSLGYVATALETALGYVVTALKTSLGYVVTTQNITG